MACANGVLKIYNLSPSGELLRLEGPKDWSDVGFSHDGQRLYAGNGDINVWTIGNPADLSFGRQLTLMESIGDDEHYFHFHPDGRRMVTSSIVEKPKIIDGDTGEVVGILEVHRDSVWSVAYSPDGTRFAIGSNDLTVRIWNTESTEQPHVLTGHSEQVSRTIFSPDGKLLASVSMN